MTITCLDGKINESAHFSSNIMNESLDGWNLIVFATNHGCFGNWGLMTFPFTIFDD